MILNLMLALILVFFMAHKVIESKAGNYQYE